jgi:hypothetical protein
MVINNKKILKVLKTNLQFTSKLYKLNLVDTMGGFLTPNSRETRMNLFWIVINITYLLVGIFWYNG